MVRAIIDWFAHIGFDGLRRWILELALLVILIIEVISFIRFYLGHPKKSKVTDAYSEKPKKSPTILRHFRKGRRRLK